MNATFNYPISHLKTQKNNRDNPFRNHYSLLLWITAMSMIGTGILVFFMISHEEKQNIKSSSFSKKITPYVPQNNPEKIFEDYQRTILNLSQTVLTYTTLNKAWIKKFKELIRHYNTLCIGKEGLKKTLEKNNQNKEPQWCLNIRKLFTSYMSIEKNLPQIKQRSFNIYNTREIEAYLSSKNLSKEDQDALKIKFDHQLFLDTSHLCGISGILLNLEIVKNIIDIFENTGEVVFTDHKNYSLEKRVKLSLNPEKAKNPIMALTDFLHTIAKIGSDLFGEDTNELINQPRIFAETPELSKSKYFSEWRALHTYTYHFGGPTITIFKNHLMQMGLAYNEKKVYSIFQPLKVKKKSLTQYTSYSQFLKTLGHAVSEYPGILKIIFASYDHHLYEVLLGDLYYQNNITLYEEENQENPINGIKALKRGKITLFNRNHLNGEISFYNPSKATLKNNAPCGFYCTPGNPEDIFVYLHFNSLLNLSEKDTNLKKFLHDIAFLHQKNFLSKMSISSGLSKIKGLF